MAIVDCATTSSPALVAHAGARLGVILDAYTIYLDLRLCSPDGIVLAHGRPKRFGDVIGRDVSAESRFVRAASLPDGESYVARQVCLGNAQVATYCAGVRAGGESRTWTVGVLAVYLNWEAQARAIVEGVRVSP